MEPNPSNILLFQQFSIIATFCPMHDVKLEENNWVVAEHLSYFNSEALLGCLEPETWQILLMRLHTLRNVTTRWGSHIGNKPSPFKPI